MNLFDVLFAKKLNKAPTPPTPSVFGEVKGNLITFTDGADAPLVECKAEIVATQDLHGYDKPWVGGAGKNKLKTDGLMQSTPSSTSFSNTTPRTFTIGTWCEGLTYNNYYASRCTNITVSEDLIQFETSAGLYGISIPIVGLTIGTTYTISATKVNGLICVGFYQSDGTYISGDYNKGAFTVPADTYYTTICFCAQTDNVQAKFTNIQLEVGSTATTYSPYSNICPISGYDEVEIEGCGKNLFDKNASDLETDKALNNNGGTTAYSGCNVSGYIEVVSGQSYTYYGSAMTSISIGFAYYDENKTFISPVEIKGGGLNPKTVTIPSGAKYVRFEVLTVAIDTIQFEIGTQTTAYEPFTDNSYTISLGSTRYGGELDVSRGVLRVTHGYVDLGSITWGSWGTNQFYTSTIPTSNPDTSVADDICEGYKCYKYSDISNVDYGFTHYVANGVPYLIFKDKNYSSGTDFKTGVDGIHLCYELATPLEISLTPTQVRSLLGNNYMSCNSGELDVLYIKEGYQEFVDLIESTFGGRKGGTKPIDVFRMLEGKQDATEEPAKDEPKEEEKR